MATSTITIGTTSRGHRIWLQGIGNRGAYTVRYAGDGTLYIAFHAEGKRKVCAAKGGIIDIVGAKVTAWAQGATTASVTDHGTFIMVEAIA